MPVDLPLQIMLSVGFFGLVGVLVWRSAIAIRRNAQEMLHGPRARDSDHVREAIAEMRQDLELLRADIDQQRGQLGELLERLDFAERLLTQMRERSSLPPGPKS